MRSSSVIAGDNSGVTSTGFVPSNILLTGFCLKPKYLPIASSLSVLLPNGSVYSTDALTSHGFAVIGTDTDDCIVSGLFISCNSFATLPSPFIYEIE